MKKKLMAVLLAGTMALSLAACGSKETPAETPSTTTEEGTDASAETPEKDPSEVKVGMVTDVGGVNDGSFNQSSWEGLQRAGEELGITVSYLESKTDADYAPNLETFVDDEYDLIIAVGYKLADATKNAAEAYPEQKFAIIDDATLADMENVQCLMFEQAQASYLVGYVAGLMTETNKVGFVLGMSNPVMDEFGYGYVAGALDANPDVTVLQQNANAFDKPELGKSAAVNMITDGADVIFHAAGGTGLGVIEACKENNIYAIGVDSDQSALAPDNMLTSAMKRVDNACYDVAKAALEGKFTSGVTTYDLSSEGVDIAPTDTLLTDEVKTAVEDLKAKIISGEIEVPKTKEAFEAVHGDAYELD